MNHVGSCSLWGSIFLNFTPLLMRVHGHQTYWQLSSVWVRLTPGGAYETTLSFKVLLWHTLPDELVTNPRWCYLIRIFANMKCFYFF